MLMFLEIAYILGNTSERKNALRDIVAHLHSQKCLQWFSEYEWCEEMYCTLSIAMPWRGRQLKRVGKLCRGDRYSPEEGGVEIVHDYSLFVLYAAAWGRRSLHNNGGQGRFFSLRKINWRRNSSPISWWVPQLSKKRTVRFIIRINRQRSH